MRICHPYTRPRRRCLAALGFLLVPAFGNGGCAGTGKTARPDPQDNPPSVASDVDPTRAYLALLEIEPAPERPKAGTPETPLSGRALAQVELARKLVGQQRFAEAAMELERAFRFDPDHPEVHRELALLNLGAGNVALALNSASRALASNPEDAIVHYVLGRCAAENGSAASAIKSLRTATLCSNFEADPARAAYCLYFLAEALSSEGYLQAALEQYSEFERRAADLEEREEALQSPAGPPANLSASARARSRILERLGRFGEAAAALSAAVGPAPEADSEGVRLARLLMRAGKFDEALAVLRAIRSDDESVLNLLTEVHEASGHPELAIDDLRHRLELRPDSTNVVALLAGTLVRLGRAGDAKDVLRGFLDSHPLSHHVRMQLADVQAALRDWDAVVQTLAAWIRQSPADSDKIEGRLKEMCEDESAVSGLLDAAGQGQQDHAAAYVRGALAALAGRLELAERLLQESLSENESFVAARAALARLYVQTFRYAEALETAGRENEEIAQDARLERVLGRTYGLLDVFERAELHCKAAIQLDRSDTAAMLELSGIHVGRGNLLKAMRQLRALLAEEPANDDAREMLAAVYMRQGEVEAAKGELEQLESLSSSPTAKARSAALLAHFGSPDEEAYRRTLLDAIEKHGPDAKTWIAIAESYQDLDDAGNMRAAYQNALAVDPRNEDALIGLVEAQTRLLAFEEAAEHLRALLPVRPNRHSWRLRLIDIYLTIQDFDAALALCEEHVGHEETGDSIGRRYRAAVIEALRLAGREDQVLERLKKWAEEDSTDAWTFYLAEEYRRQDKDAQAVEILESKLPERPEVVPELVDALIASGRPSRAAQYMLDRLDQDPANDESVALLAYALALSERAQDAVELIRNKLLYTLRREYLQDRLLAHLQIAKQPRQAIELTEALIDEVLSVMRTLHERRKREPLRRLTDAEIIRRPDEPFSLSRLHARLRELRLKLAETMIRAEEHRDAQVQLSSWLDDARSPEEQKEILGLLAICYQLRGDEKRANETYERTLALDPGDESLNNNVAYTWTDRGVRMDEAERLIRYALWRAPRQAAYLDTYGWLLYKKGSFQEAGKWLQRAHRAMPEPDPVVLNHLGDNYWRLGLPEKAIASWTAAVEADKARADPLVVAGDRARVRDVTPQKIEDARAGGTPEVEPLAQAPAELDSNGESDTPPTDR